MKVLGRIVLPMLCAVGLPAQVSYQDLLNAEATPENWLTYSGTYKSQHYSGLKQITRENVGDLEFKWAFHGSPKGKLQTTPLVVDGVMYLTEGNNDVTALDAKTGRRFWTCSHTLPKKVHVVALTNRGAALLDDRVFTGTLDGRLIALDAKTGHVLWDKKVCDYTKGYAVTMAPLAVKDKVIVGTAGGEFGIRGYIDAYDAATGERAWRFYTIPGPGEPGHESWENDAWKTGGGSAWVTGSFDPELNLTYWGIGNPSPDWNGDVRPGDNLYSGSVVALDADTGKLKWHFQFTPHDTWDWDAVQIPVLVDREFRGRQRKLMLWGNRNAFFYVLDRESGEFLLGKPFTKQTWAERLDENGRPIKLPGMEPTKEGTKVYPAVQGATNWYAPSYSPRTGLFYLQAWVDFWGMFYSGEPVYTPGNRYDGSLIQRTVPIRTQHEDIGYGAIRALDPETGERKWEFKMTEISESGLLTTAGDLLFSGNFEGNFMALDAETGKLLWRTLLGARIDNSPISYMVDGKQYVSVKSGLTLFTFGLRD